MKSFLKVVVVFLISALGVLFLGGDVKAAETEVIFNVDNDFEIDGRSRVTGVLVKTTPHLYFYVEKDWWRFQTLGKRDEALESLERLSREFSEKIYPELTSSFGEEWNPGIDRDSRITFLFHEMTDGAGGYFRAADEYPKIQLPISNEREMLYFSASRINNPQLKIFVAHEFVHLITFNQKNRLRAVQDDVWLNEARADYAPTLLGYNDFYEGSGLQRRVRDFLEKPDDSLTEWKETKYDYGVASLWAHYLVDQYGEEILTTSLKTKSVGIKSIDEALLKAGAKENFSQVFTNWTIAVAVNDCAVHPRYCYLNENLGNMRLNPTLNFLPFAKNSSLSITTYTTDWAGNWQKIIGGNGDLKLRFANPGRAAFKIPYLLLDKNSSYSIQFLTLNERREGEITIEDFNNKYNSLLIVPSLQTKVAGFNGSEPVSSYALTVSSVASIEEEEAEIQRLLAQIEDIKRQIAAFGGNPGPATAPSQGCSLSFNLYFGVSYSSQVRCLQAFLKSQGSEIYPEGLVTGVFGSLTQAAVTRFQEKYRAEILSPSGLSRGTGYVGKATRTKINELLAQ